jgi:hypothetical protein
MRHFCQFGLCCDLVTCGHGVGDDVQFLGVVWLCEYHAARNRADALNLDAPFTTFDRLASLLPRRGPISEKQRDAFLEFLGGIS